ncbi:hypothetical protein Pst134EB_021966 [Puccinia striiformis f. sp. tritici]|uniref:Uncharacterized protein n=1 Tax=Puccinia striiformis f. sp. tritici PST-78 TaxID=1165861 RepID=A0A0L0VQ84_9BASI|nr:hypothetical protein Pst134EB_021966 [Puccinia striiformis f. sp. tritici]KNF01160.1 hypothetical protein PSTG_05514 [Puccinia striiformis f. sp. tritici PST-78]
MLFSTSFTSMVFLASCQSILGAPANTTTTGTPTTLTPRQTTANPNGAMKNMSTAMNAPKSTPGGDMSDLQKELLEAQEEKKVGINTIANAINELYFHDKYASQKHDTPVMVKMIGQVAANNAKTCDPETVAKAIVAIYEPYNKAASSPTKSAAMVDDNSPSIQTIAHSLHETWEKSITTKVDNSVLLPTICQTIATSSTSGDPTIVSKAIEAAYAKLVPGN